MERSAARGYVSRLFRARCRLRARWPRTRRLTGNAGRTRPAQAVGEHRRPLHDDRWSAVTCVATSASATIRLTSTVVRLVGGSVRWRDSSGAPSARVKTRLTSAGRALGLSSASVSWYGLAVEPSGRNHSLAGLATPLESVPPRPWPKYTARSATIGWSDSTLAPKLTFGSTGSA